MTIAEAGCISPCYTPREALLFHGTLFIKFSASSCFFSFASLQALLQAVSLLKVCHNEESLVSATR